MLSYFDINGNAAHAAVFIEEAFFSSSEDQRTSMSQDCVISGYALGSGVATHYAALVFLHEMPPLAPS